MITQNRLKELFYYDIKSGIFTRLKTTGGKISGEVAGCVSKNGYIKIRVDGKSLQAHRLAWLYMYGEFPVEDIDHINHIRTDNSKDNLRLANDKTNSLNRSLYKNNSSGVVGVNWYKPYAKWNAQIQKEGKKINLGYFCEFHEAVNARKNAEVIYEFHENHGGI